MEFFASKALKEKWKRCSSCHSSLAKFYGRFISDSHFMFFFLKLGRQPKPVLNTFERRTALLWNGKVFFFTASAAVCSSTTGCESRPWVCALSAPGSRRWFVNAVLQPKGRAFVSSSTEFVPSFLFSFHLNKNIRSKRHFKWVRQEGARVWFLYLSQ